VKSFPFFDDFSVTVRNIQAIFNTLCSEKYVVIMAKIKLAFLINKILNEYDF